MNIGYWLLGRMDALEKWIIIQFTLYQTTTLSKWISFQKLLFKSSLLLNGFSAAFKYICTMYIIHPSANCDDLCLLFCLYLSSMIGTMPGEKVTGCVCVWNA